MQNKTMLTGRVIYALFTLLSGLGLVLFNYGIQGFAWLLGTLGVKTGPLHTVSSIALSFVLCVSVGWLLVTTTTRLLHGRLIDEEPAGLKKILWVQLVSMCFLLPAVLWLAFSLLTGVTHHDGVLWSITVVLGVALAALIAWSVGIESESDEIPGSSDFTRKASSKMFDWRAGSAFVGETLLAASALCFMAVVNATIVLVVTFYAAISMEDYLHAKGIIDHWSPGVEKSTLLVFPALITLVLLSILSSTLCRTFYQKWVIEPARALTDKPLRHVDNSVWFFLLSSPFGMLLLMAILPGVMRNVSTRYDMAGNLVEKTGWGAPWMDMAAVAVVYFFLSVLVHLIVVIKVRRESNISG